MKKIVTIICCWLLLSIEFDFAALHADGLREVSLVLLFLIAFFYYRSLPALYKNVIMLNGAGVWMFIYLVYIIMSMYWTVDLPDAPAALIGIFICFFFSYLVSNKLDYEFFIKNLLQVIALTVLASWLLFAVNSKLALNREAFFRFKGLYSHSQRLSLALAAFLILIYLNKKLITPRNKRYFLVGLICITLLLTKTRANTTFLLATLFFAYVETKKRYILLIPLVLLIILGFYFNLTESIESIYQRGNSDIAELSGRTVLWAKLLLLIKKKWLFGYGFGVFKSFPILVFSWAPEHAHNLWLMLLYETGLLGAILFQIFLIYGFVVSGKHLRKFGFSYARYILVFIFMSSFTGLLIGGLVTPMYFITLITVFIETNRLKSCNAIV